MDRLEGKETCSLAVRVPAPKVWSRVDSALDSSGAETLPRSAGVLLYYNTRPAAQIPQF
jgi:hypothetical protein